MTNSIPPTGLERIAMLEVEMRALKEDVEALLVSVRNVENLLTQGRGGMRVFQMLVALAIFVGFGEVFRAKFVAVLQWLGK